MTDRLLFLTGKLARPRLEAVVRGLGLPEGSWDVADVGVKIAALMTEAIIRRRLPAPVAADRVVLPGRCRADLAALGRHFGARFERGPDDLVDLPAYFGKGGAPPDLSQHDLRIFAEIVDAPKLAPEAILAKGRALVAAGADVVDLGCLPDTPFPHLEETVALLAAAGLTVSVDSGDPDDLRRGGRAGAAYLLSLDESTLHIAQATGAVPVLVPRPHGDLDSLVRAIDAADARGIAHLADPVLDPIHFGFTESLERYAALRRARPAVEILMGTGNLTELTEADSGGVTAVLAGICSELSIRNVLVVHVSPHTVRTVQEHDAARRLMYRARADTSLPKGFRAGLVGLHDMRPFPQSSDEIAAAAREVRDPNFRIEVAGDGVHVYNREGHHVSADPFSLFPALKVDADGPHAFYLGYELAKAEIAFKLGKRYAQDNPLDWGVAADRPSEDLSRHAPAGVTLAASRAAADSARPGASDADDRRDDPDDP